MSAQTLPLPRAARTGFGPKLTALFAALALILASMAFAAPVFAAAIVVTEDEDELNTDGDCSLREAIAAANTDAVVDACLAGTGDTDEITVPDGSYQLTVALGDLEVDESVSIVGESRAGTIIRGPDGDRVFYLSVGDIQIANVTITGGRTGSNNGAGIYVDFDATLFLLNSTVDDNHGTEESVGGGIYVADSASATITGSTISNNGAILGGGIHNSRGDVSLVNSTVSGNTSLFEGGGIWTDGDLSLLNTTVDNNGSASGGGIFLEGSQTDPFVTIDSSTIHSNSAIAVRGGGQGGAIRSTVDFAMVNTTVSFNTASFEGGGIWSFADLRADFSTIADNEVLDTDGGGIWLIGVLELFATIVANNVNGDCFNGDASFNSFGSNIDSDNTCGLDEPTDQPDVDPLLGPLQDNGGPTLTRALLAGSPAIDAVVTSTDLPCVALDQRGTVRPQDGDGDLALACDVGAYEVLGAVGGSPSPGSASPIASPTSSTLPDTAGSSGTPASAPWLTFAVLALISAAAIAWGGVHRRRSA